MTRLAFEAVPRAADANYDPVPFAQMRIYLAGTTTPVTAYSDVDMLTAQTFPIIANSAGRFPEVYIPDGSYKVRISDATGLTIEEADYVETGLVPEAFSDVAVMKSTPALGAGDVVQTQGYYTPGDGGGGTYTVMTSADFGGTPNGFSDHALDNGLVAKLVQISGLFIAEQYGVKAGIEASARIQACYDTTVTYSASGVNMATMVMASQPNIKDQLVLGGAGHSGMNINFSASELNVVAGGNITAATPAIYCQITNGKMSWCDINLNKLGAGYQFYSCAGSYMRGAFANRFIGWGVKVNGDAPGNNTFDDIGGMEWGPYTDPTQFNTPSAWLYDTLILDGQDFVVQNSNRIGWARRNIYLGSNATNVRIMACHPYNGNPRIAEGGIQVPRSSPISIESDAGGRCWVSECYLDNGYILDNTSKLSIAANCFHLVLTDRVTMSDPYVRIVPNAISTNDQFRALGFNSSFGFFAADHITPDSRYAYLDANPSEYKGPSHQTIVGRTLNFIIPNDITDDIHFNVYKSGVKPFEQRIVTNNNTTPADDDMHLRVGGGLWLYNGALRSSALRPSGYNPGAGSAVTQITSRTTAVTSDTPTGRITVVSGAGSATPVTFQVNCAALGGDDNVIPNQHGGANTYAIAIKKQVGGGVFFVTYWSVGGTATEVFGIDYGIQAGATS